MQEDNGAESDNKRARVDRSLAELLSRMAKVSSNDQEMQLAGDGMYLPEYKRFVKFATCEEKAWLRNTLQPYEANPAKAKNVELTAQISAWYDAIWNTHMQRDIHQGEGVILLLIEPINNPFVDGNEHTWVGVLTDYVPIKASWATKPDIAFHRCNGFAPYIFELAFRKKLSYQKECFNSNAMPSFVHVLGYMTRHSSVYTRLRCSYGDMALGAVIKAMAYHLFPTSTKYDFKKPETQDLIGMSFFGVGTLLPILVSNQIVASAENLVPLPISISLFGDKKQDVTFYAASSSKHSAPPKHSDAPAPSLPIKQEVLFKHSVPPIPLQEMDLAFLFEVKRLSCVHPNGYIFQIASYHINKQGIDPSLSCLDAKRQLIRLKNWNSIINSSQLHDWDKLLAQALKIEMYGFGDKQTNYSLRSFYSQLVIIQTKHSLDFLKVLLPQLYWVMLNCDQVELINFRMSELSLTKFVSEFQKVGNIYFAEDAWLLLRGIEDHDIIHFYLEKCLLNNPILKPKMYTSSYLSNNM